MKVIERMVQEIFPGQGEALDDIDKRYDAIENTLGFPPKKRMWSISGPHPTNTLVLEREWESMAAMETAFEKAFEHEGIKALWKEGEAIIKSSCIELYWTV